MRKPISLMLGLALVAAACGGEAEPAADDSATTSSSSTQPATTTSTILATTTTVAEETLSLEEFLALYYSAFGDLTLTEPRLFQALVFGEGYYSAIAASWRSLSDAMSDLDPPATAENVYARGIAVWGDYADLYVLLQAETDPTSEGEPADQYELTRLGVIVGGIEEAFNEVATEALLAMDTDISRYIAQGIVLRDSFQPVFLDALFTLSASDLELEDSPEEMRAIADQLLELSFDWARQDVPDEIGLLQDEQALIFDLAISALTSTANFIEGGGDVTYEDLVAFGSLQGAETVVKSGWAYATAAVFRGNDDILVAYAAGIEPEFGSSSSTSTDVFAIRVGECFDDVGGDTVYELPVVDCGNPHDNEVFFGFDVEGETFPGAGPVDDLAGAGCFEEFEPFVGRSYEESALFLSWLVPSAESWQIGDREILCFVWQPDEKLTGTMESSGL